MTKTQKYSKFPGFPAIKIDSATLRRIENDKNKPTATSVIAAADRQLPGWRNKFTFHHKGL